jgi:hypothetical protein
VLGDMRRQIEEELGRVGCELPDNAFVFSHELTGEMPWEPNWVTKKVSDVAASVGIAMTVKSLRHYSASQLLAGGIDLRNTACQTRSWRRRRYDVAPLRRPGFRSRPPRGCVLGKTHPFR